jgi:hypothetical protein
VICAALAAAPSAPAETGSIELRLTSVQTKFVTVDVKPDSGRAGDTEIAMASIYNGVTPAAIGHGTLLCTVLTRATRSCEATYVLPQGQIMTDSVIGSLRSFEVAIVGGTGLYDKVRGSLSVTTTTLRPLRQRLSFHLLDVALPLAVVAPAAVLAPPPEAPATVPASPTVSSPATTVPSPPELATSPGRGRKVGHLGKSHGHGHDDGRGHHDGG